jgi:hypothetical protein
MALASIIFIMVALGVVLLLLGVILLAKHAKVAGLIVALLGLCMVTIPIFAYLYVWAAMR